MEPPLDLERFATLSAELDAGTHRDELCAREGISLADWSASQEAWLSRLAEETARKRFVLTNRYNNAFVARRRTLSHGPRFPAQKVVAARDPRPELAAPPPLEVAPPPPVVIAMPSMALIGEPPPVYREPPPVYPEPVVEPPTMPRPVVRAAKAATVALSAFTEPVTAPLPFVPAPDTESATVTGASPLAKSRMALPFKPAEPGAAPPVVTAPAPPPHPVARGVVDLGETGTLETMSPFATGHDLPFQAGAPSVPVPPPSNPGKRPPSAPPPAPALDGTSTVYGAMSPFATPEAALPFHGAAPAPARPAAPHSSAGLPFHAGAAPPGGAPAPAPMGSPAARPSPSATGTTRLTLEQFASLTAEIAVNPRGVAQIRARYGFDEASHRAEAEEHNRHFTADKALYARYMELFQSYREWVARAPR